MAEIVDHPKRHLKPSDDGGNSGDMEPRLARLEAHMEHAQSDLTGLKGDVRDIRDRLARLEEKVSHLPGKGFIVGSTVTTLALITALIAFQEQVQAFLIR